VKLKRTRALAGKKGGCSLSGKKSVGEKRGFWRKKKNTKKKKGGVLWRGPWPVGKR